MDNEFCKIVLIICWLNYWNKRRYIKFIFCLWNFVGDFLFFLVVVYKVVGCFGVILLVILNFLGIFFGILIDGLVLFFFRVELFVWVLIFLVLCFGKVLCFLSFLFWCECKDNFFFILLFFCLWVIIDEWRFLRFFVFVCK